ncbi:uncharacterized protein A1O9_12727 [Exophiala aquamarina CBS 119918]|uniref:Uncharacterized protein n=1 Tax=Exophiala aquamarina CBS 119918 TaxID=1182545 RepID=A0A072NTN7_9EURO|nr:uncharacterized protein A1O9_12727 [Exophiala aquamarina CBS 119918]KEF51224.1 hypothetical protein A1O9_12727 [Exophiala aquamarina CBS 119918]
MGDWESDEFMSDWDKTYVSTNVKPGSRSYDKDFFLGLRSSFQDQPPLESISDAIIATACCAVGRADVVGRFFDDITHDLSPEESQAIFLRLRESITFVFPYLGIPTCIPACYGMIGVVKRKGWEFASTERLRGRMISVDDAKRGRELRTSVYRNVGNSEIFGLMDTYFTDLFMCSTVVTWGYLLARANEKLFQIHESHLVVAATIMALGATRQTKSHIKATLGLGSSVQSVKAVMNVVGQISDWADRPLVDFDVDELAGQVQQGVGR